MTRYLDRPPTLAKWAAQGGPVSVNGRRLFVVDAGPTDTEAIVVLHGYPTCSYDYWRVLPDLSAERRVILHDHLGFGLSDKPRDYSYSLIQQADMALALWQSLGVRRAHLVAHDYGTSVATEILDRCYHGDVGVDFATLTLCNGSVFIEMAKLRPAQKLLRDPLAGPFVARLMNRGLFGRNLRALFADPTQLTDAELDALWQAATTNGGRDVIPQVTGYLRERETHGPRWAAALVHFDRPSLVLWGDEDPVAVPAIAERLARELFAPTLTWLHGVGHYPMLEAPEAWSDAVLDWLEAPGEER